MWNSIVVVAMWLKEMLICYRPAVAPLPLPIEILSFFAITLLTMLDRKRGEKINKRHRMREKKIKDVFEYVFILLFSKIVFKN